MTTNSTLGVTRDCSQKEISQFIFYDPPTLVPVNFLTTIYTKRLMGSSFVILSLLSRV